MIDDSRTVRLTFRDDVRRNPLWGLVVVAGIGFVVTCLAWVMAGLTTNPSTTVATDISPVARFLNKQGALLIGGEAAVIVLGGILAMTVDRIQTLREQTIGSGRSS